MSPPCIPTIYEGDNGGATSSGVSVAEIRVAVPINSMSTAYTAPIDALFEYVNRNFELYGRRLVPVYVPGSASTALDARSRAAEAAAQKVFAAVTGANEWQQAQASLPVELARQSIVTVVRGGSTWWTDRTLYDAYDPYVWSVYPSSEDIQANLADFACTALAGHAASHAGDQNLIGRPRRFGVVTAGQVQAPTAAVLTRALADCTGVEPIKFEWTSPQGSAVLRPGMERMRSGPSGSDGATTLFCVCEAGLAQSAIAEAHNAGFHPEWVLAPTYWATGNDEEWVQRFRQAGQLAAPIRLGASPRILPLQARPWFGALQSILLPGTSTSTQVSMGEFVYPELLVLASGIQGAGPQLTPETFQQALLTTQFANPNAGRPPFWQPSAGFGAGDHSFFDDYNVAWWSDQAEAYDLAIGSKPQGSWCYLDQAARFRAGSYPSDAEARMFNPGVPCR